MVFLIICISIINKEYNNLWNFIRDISGLGYVELRQKCVERLLAVHGADLDHENSNKHLNFKAANIKKTKFNIYLKYISLLSIFIIITIAYYLIMHLEFYPICERNLIDRPEEISNYTRRRIFIPLVVFWARETGIYRKIEDIHSLFPENFIFKNPKQELDDLLTLKYTTALQIYKYIYSMPSETRITTFESINTTHVGLSYGTYWYMNNLLFDAFVIQNTNENIERFVEKFSQNSLFLQSEMTKNFRALDDTTQIEIAKYLNYIIYSIVLYGGIALILYFFCYLPFIGNEIKRLKRLQVIISIIPISTQVIKNQRN